MSIKPGKPERENLRCLLELARREDLGSGDVTSALLPGDASAVGRFVARRGLVVCGGSLLADIAHAYDPAIRTEVKLPDGDRAIAGTLLAAWTGPARGVLAAERVALNFFQRLSGIATETRAYVDAVAGTGAKIYDTRKMTPGWRALEKYAVRAGGGRNHRIGLFDAVLVKDNHWAILSRTGDAASALAEKLPGARARLGPDGFVEVEVDSIEQLEAALRLPLDVILLDNMPPEQLRRCVALRDRAGLKGRVALEASGGITLANVRAVAQTGVERIAVGAITHSAGAADIALDFD